MPRGHGFLSKIGDMIMAGKTKAEIQAAFPKKNIDLPYSWGMSFLRRHKWTSPKQAADVRLSKNLRSASTIVPSIPNPWQMKSKLKKALGREPTTAELYREINKGTREVNR